MTNKIKLYCVLQNKELICGYPHEEIAKQVAKKIQDYSVYRDVEIITGTLTFDENEQ